MADKYIPPGNLELLGKVWDNIKVFFTGQWADVWTGFGEIADSLQDSTTKKFFNWLKELDDPLWEDTFNYLLAEKLITEDQKIFINNLKDLPPPINFLAWSAFISSFFSQYLYTIGSANMEIARQRVAEQTMSELPPIEALVKSGFIAPERMWHIKKQLKKYGFSEETQDYLFLSHYRLYDVGEIMMLWLRGVLSNDDMYMRMRELGFTDTRTAELVQLYEVIPGPQDLFQLVAKEAFEPDMVKKIGLDEEFPESQVQWLEKQGVSRFWAEKYWAAHWQQPSPQQGFEMLHRGLITDDELDMLFRAIELPTFWRDRMKGISYLPYARVDLRRLWKEGILIDPEQIFKEYKWQGYDDEHALNLTKFAIADAEESEKNLSMTQIMNAFVDRLIDRKHTKQLVMSLGYGNDKAEFIIVSKEYEIEEKATKIEIDIIKTRYIKRQMDKFGAYRDLNLLNLRSNYINALLDNWELDLVKTEKLPSKSEITKWWKQKIIGNDNFLSYMKQLGYSDETSANQLKSLHLDEMPVGKAKPNKKELDDLLTNNIINKEDYKAEMSEIGYVDRYINMFLTLLTGDLPK